jgi:uncharacterized membrane protein
MKQMQGQAETDGERTKFGIMVQENLLPTPEDLAKFKEIEPSIVAWMMQHASKEQEARISFQSSAIRLEQEKPLFGLRFL